MFGREDFALLACRDHQGGTPRRSWKYHSQNADAARPRVKYLLQVFKLKNVRRAPGQAGQLKRFFQTVRKRLSSLGSSKFTLIVPLRSWPKPKCPST